MKSDLPLPRSPTGESPAIRCSCWLVNGLLICFALALAVDAAEEPTESDHWSFQPLVRPELPVTRNHAWLRNAIDTFILARLEATEIEPSPEADKITLLRRLCFDLVGLPPAPHQVDRFLADESPDALERLVDRLLASPHYGEKWGLHWLDLAMYADSDGFEKDRVRPHAWRWRHWVVETLNADKPFDQFTVEQIAGDLLPDATTDQRIATGFHRNALTNREGGTFPEQFRFEQTVERTKTVGAVWLGLTVGCAQCHDHKYDPIQQREFYELFAYFNTTEDHDLDARLAGELEPYRNTRADFLRKRAELLARYRVPPIQAAWEEKLRYTQAHQGASTPWDIHFRRLTIYVDNAKKILHRPRAERTFHEDDGLLKYFLVEYKAVTTTERWEKLKFPELAGKLAALQAAYPKLSRAQTIRQDSLPRKSHIHIRGDYYQPAEEVQPSTLNVMHPLPDGAELNRLTLARWLISRNNPLTARVVVNRTWQELFGRGIVRTSEDFGIQGDEPTHPKLLDWLAVELHDSRWSIKRMHRLIVTSAAYRQSSHAPAKLVERDPENTLIARQRRLRLSAEMIRDAALAASGLLYTKIGGKSIYPPQPPSVAKLGFADKIQWVESLAPDKYRRGLYIHLQRTIRYPMMANFDAPDSSIACTRRERSNTPLQALNLLNDPVFFEAAQALAARTLREAPAEFDRRLNHAYRLCLARLPGEWERWRMHDYYQRQIDLLAKQPPKSIEPLLPADIGAVDHLEAAAWVGVARVLLNLDEFITRE